MERLPLCRLLLGQVAGLKHLLRLEPSCREVAGCAGIGLVALPADSTCSPSARGLGGKPAWEGGVCLEMVLTSLESVDS